jgi:hypothetical protein
LGKETASLLRTETWQAEGSDFITLHWRLPSPYPDYKPRPYSRVESRTILTWVSLKDSKPEGKNK